VGIEDQPVRRGMALPSISLRCGQIQILSKHLPEQTMDID